MSWGMDPTGDITDEFDDDSLRSSIENAKAAGQWRDNAPDFVDPKLETIKKQLAEPERANYAERRLRELQRQAAARTPPPPAPGRQQKPEKVAAPAGLDWSSVEPSKFQPTNGPDTAGRTEPQLAAEPPRKAETTPPLPAPVEEPRYVVPGAASHPALQLFGPLLVGPCVFGPVAALHMAFVGWRYDLLARAIAASVLMGLAWKMFDADRFRGASIGVGIHLILFFATAASWSTREVAGNSVGFVVTLLVSCLLGTVNEIRTGQHRR